MINIEEWDFNHFTQQKSIGKGDHGEVFIVENNQTHMIYQAKIYYENVINSSLLGKLNTLSNLNHPSISPIIGYSSSENHLITFSNYYESSLTKYIDGNNTFHYLNIIHKIASGMAYLHSQNVTHQDLKPSNILLDNQLNPYISDFITLNIKVIKKKGPEIVGTSIYTAPEIWKGQDYSKSSDVYSFAMIIYEIITSKRPFQGMNPFQIVAKIVQDERPELNSSIPQTYKCLIQKCWSSDPNERPTFDQIVNFLEKKDPSILEAGQIEPKTKSETKEESEKESKKESENESKEESENESKEESENESKEESENESKEESENESKEESENESKEEFESELSKRSKKESKLNLPNLKSESKEESDSKFSKKSEKHSDFSSAQQSRRKLRFSCCCSVDDDSDDKCYKKKLCKKVNSVSECSYSCSEHSISSNASFRKTPAKRRSYNSYSSGNEEQIRRPINSKGYDDHLNKNCAISVSSTYTTEDNCDYDSSSESKSSNDNDESCSKKHFNDDLKNKTIDLNSFVKRQKIGEGGFGCVYKITHKLNTSQQYVAKISKKRISNILSKNDIDAISLRHEISIQSRLDHPLIIKFIGYSLFDFEKYPKPVIVSEYLANGSLDNILMDEQKSLASSQWTDTKKLINIYGIASAMMYLHKNNILHLDLKAENILVDSNFFPKLSDFGLSKDFSQKVRRLDVKNDNGFRGTPTRIAPEIWNGDEYSKKVDVYAFGLTVFEIMNNEKPFHELNNVYQIMIEVSIMGHRPAFKYQIPKRYRKLIEDCWSQNPNDRPSFEDIVDSLRNDTDFITDTIDEVEFLNFIDLIDQLTNKNVVESSQKIMSRDIIIDENVVEKSCDLNSSLLRNSSQKKVVENDEEIKIVDNMNNDDLLL